MPHYKSPERALHWLDSEEFEYLLPPGCEMIGEEEAQSLSKEIQNAANAITPEDEKRRVEARKDQLLAQAALRVAPLQDAVDLGSSTQEDVNLLKLWKEYRVSVDRVDRQEGYPSLIEWPKEPA